MRLTFAALAGLVVLLPLGLVGASRGGGPATLFDPTLLAGEIPETMLYAYLDAAAVWELDWALLAAIGKLECDHGRSELPGCWPPGTVNSSGARGPMQFLGSTWRASAGRRDLEVAGPPVVDSRYGYATDGDGDGIADPWSIYDSVHAAARYLVDLGGRDDPRTAARRYNAGPNHPDPTVGAGYATRAIEHATHYHRLAGAGGPGAQHTTHADDGCTVRDPTGTGGCVTPRTANLVFQLRRTFGPLPIWCWATRPANPTSDHPHGRACDITVGVLGRMPTAAQRQHGWQLADWIVAHADELAIAYVIWDGRIWTPTNGWQPYTSSVYDVRNPTGGHHDHLHISTRSRP